MSRAGIGRDVRRGERHAPDLKLCLDMPAKADRTVAAFATPIQGEIDKAYGDGMADIIAGKATPRAMLDDLQARMKPLLEDALR